MDKSKKQETYEQAMKRLEAIISRIDNNELDIDELSDVIKEGNSIIEFCYDKLINAGKEVKKTMKESSNLKIKE